MGALGALMLLRPSSFGPTTRTFFWPTRNYASKAASSKKKPWLPKKSQDVPLSKRVARTGQLIDIAAKANVGQQPDLAWPVKHSSKDFQDVLQRTEDKTRRSRDSLGVAPPSIEKQNLEQRQHQNFRDEAVISELDVSDVRSSYAPGTYVELFDDNHGVVLCEVFSEYERRWHVLVLSQRGEMLSPSRDDITFSASNFVSGDLAERCGSGPSSENAFQQGARVEVIKQLRTLAIQIEQVMGIFNPDRTEVYEVVRAKDPNQWGRTTISDVLALVKPKQKLPELVMVVVVHRFLVQDPSKFVIDEQYRLNETFLVRPKAVVDRYNLVKGWIQRHKDLPQIKSFIRKARLMLPEQDRLHQSTLDSPPSRQFLPETVLRRFPQTPNWTKDDKTIIQFLFDGMTRPNTLQEDPYLLANTHILKQIFPDNQEVDHHDVHTLLAGVGAIAPWQDYFSLGDNDPHLLQSPPQDATRNKRIIEAARSNQPVAGQILGPEDLIPRDPLDSLRVDFGELPVYIVDDATASELDDGISIEPVHNDPDSYWCHIHIADPSSILHPDHIFCLDARRQGETLYFVNSTKPLFPRELMFSGLPGSSLVNSQNGTSQNVMTFSARVNSKGSILDYKVRPGCVRRATRFTYDSIDLAFGRGLVKRSYPFGIPDEAKPDLEFAETNVAQFNESQKKDWEQLNTVTSWMIRRRLEDDAFIGSSGGAQVRLFSPPEDLPLPLWNTTKPGNEKPTLFAGMPPMLYTVSPSEELDKGARQTVAEMMKLACRVASLFYKDHNIPALRRISNRPILSSPNALQELLDMRDPGGYVPQAEYLKRTIMPSSAGYSTAPMAHFSMAVKEEEGYSRVTSPLRRYVDLVGHWQIQSFLLNGKPRFDERWMAQFGEESELRGRAIRRMNGVHLSSWLVLCIKHQFDMNASLEDWTLTGQIFSIPTKSRILRLTTYHIFVPKLGMKFLVDDDRPDIHLRLAIGDEVQARPKIVRQGTKPMIVLRAVGE